MLNQIFKLVCFYLATVLIGCAPSQRDIAVKAYKETFFYECVGRFEVNEKGVTLGSTADIESNLDKWKPLLPDARIKALADSVLQLTVQNAAAICDYDWDVVKPRLNCVIGYCMEMYRSPILEAEAKRWYRENRRRRK